MGWGITLWGIIDPFSRSAMLIRNLVILLKAVYSGNLDTRGVRSKKPGGSRKRAKVLKYLFSKQIELSCTLLKPRHGILQFRSFDWFTHHRPQIW